MQIDVADFRDWMSFLSFNLIEKNSLNPEARSANTFNQHEIAEETKKYNL